MAFTILLDGDAHEIDILRRRPHLVIAIDGREYVVQDMGSEGEGGCRLTIAGRELSLVRAMSEGAQILRTGGRTHAVALFVEGDAEDGGNALSEVRAPMPGAVIAVDVVPGDSVVMGAPLVTIESMKLQTVLSAPRDGEIEEVLLMAGDVFNKDQVIVRLVRQEGVAEDA